jgi:hypothetical protein
VNYREYLESAEGVDVDSAEDDDGDVGDVDFFLYLFEEDDDVPQLDPHLALLLLFNSLTPHK